MGIYQKSYIFLLTFITYASMYTTRISWSFCKSNFQKDMNISNDFLGTIDMCFFISISLAFGVTDLVARKMNVRQFLSIGFIPSALVFLSLPIMKFNNINSRPMILLAMSLNGIFQSPIWPSLVVIMGNWFKNGRGPLLGIWSANANFGNILGLQICHIILNIYGLSWEYCFLVSGLFMLSMGIYNLLFLKEAPDEDKDEQKIKEEKKKVESNKQSHQQEEKAKENQIKLNFINVWLVPGVTSFTLSYCCMKSANFGLMFWLPKYLNEANLIQHTALITQVLQVGSFFGGLIIGYLNDKLGKTAIVMVPIVSSASIFLTLFKTYSGLNILPYCIYIFAIGACLIGPYNILGSATSIQLSEQPMLKGNPTSVIFISSLIEGVSGIFSAFIQQVIPIIGPQNLFSLFMLLCILSGISLLPILIKEIKSIFSKHVKELKKE